MTIEKISEAPKPPKNLAELNPNGGQEIKRRGRKSKGELQIQEDKPLMPPADLPLGAVIPIVSIPFSIAARITDFKDWELTEQENLDLAKAVKECADTYMPYILDKWMPLITLMVVAGSLTMVKAKSYSEYKKVLEAKFDAEQKAKVSFIPDDASQKK